jgi:hypothetical protein
MSDDFDRREAWRSVVWSSVLDIGSGIAGAMAFRSQSWLPVWAMLQFAAVGAVVMAAALIWRAAPRRVLLVLFSLNVASALITALAGAQTFAHANRMEDLFQSLKAGLFVIAILSPSLPVGVGWIVVFTLAPIVLVHTWAADVRQMVPSWDPWFVLVYGGIALVMLLYRRRSVALEHQLAEARAERLSVERLARVSLAIRDLANTPLQTLTTGVALLRRDVTERERVLAPMERALARLEKLRLALAPFELAWQPGDESFDALARIERAGDEVSK